MAASSSGSVVTWNIGGLAARTSVTRTVTVQVNSTVAAGVNSLTNTASATDDGAGGPDPTPANNTDTDTDTLVANPDLAVTKTDGRDQRAAGADPHLHPDHHATSATRAPPA